MIDLFWVDEEHELTRAPADVLIMLGVLKPDTRLQAIADVWGKEYHDDPIPNDWKYEIRKWWPELGTLLDALTEEEEE